MQIWNRHEISVQIAISEFWVTYPWDWADSFYPALVIAVTYRIVVTCFEAEAMVLRRWTGQK